MVNGSLQSHDPFAVDEARWLEALDRDWGRIFLVSVCNDQWYANRLNGTGDAIIAATPGELAAAMGAAWRGGAQ
jgi:hypothetical protein